MARGVTFGGGAWRRAGGLTQASADGVETSRARFLGARAHYFLARHLSFFFSYLQPSVVLHSRFDSPEHDEAALHCFFL